VLAYEDLCAMDPNHIGEEIKEIVHDLYRRREQAIGPDTMREIERSWLLRTVDRWWMEHLREMDDLRDSIGLRGYGQRDPLIEYQKEGYECFERMVDHIAEDMTQAIMMSEESVEREEQDLGQLETFLPARRGTAKGRWKRPPRTAEVARPPTMPLLNQTATTHARAAAAKSTRSAVCSKRIIRMRDEPRPCLR